MSDYYATSVESLPLFRRTDPVTSKAAGVAAREFKGDHERRILGVVGARAGAPGRDRTTLWADARRRLATPSGDGTGRADRKGRGRSR